MTVPADSEHVPCDGVAESNVTPAGSVSVRLAAVTASGPEFSTMSVYVSCCPSSSGSGESVLVSDRSAAWSTVVSALALLSKGSGSTTRERTLAWFVIEPALCGLTSIVTVALASSARLPSAQSTMPASSEHVPCEGVADSKVTPAGSVSVS